MCVGVCIIYEMRTLKGKKARKKEKKTSAYYTRHTDCRHTVTVNCTLRVHALRRRSTPLCTRGVHREYSFRVTYKYGLVYFKVKESNS